MSNEDKDLLVRDLCARLPYGVKVQVTLPWANDVEFASDIKIRRLNACLLNVALDHDKPVVKPYLRHPSDMTADEEEQLEKFMVPTSCFDYENNGLKAAVFWDELCNAIDWLNEHHFDYRDLIEKGLALEAPIGMYNS